MKINPLLLILLIPLVLTSCVSSKKYKELETRNNSVNRQLLKANNDVKDLKSEREELSSKLNKVNTNYSSLKEGNDDLTNKFNKLTNDYKELEDQYNTLLTQNEQQLASASSTTQQLNKALSDKQKELEDKAKELAALEKSLNDSKATLAESQALLDEATNAIADREKRLNEMEAIIKQQEEKTEALRKTISKALLGFKESDLTVEEKNGKVYVSLSQNLLFASGSTTMDKKGTAAIKKLAEVLNANPDIDIEVEGHTDNVPFRGRAGMRDNWDLSVLRSTSLVRELVKNKVEPQRITAAGRGEYIPVADNATKDGKAKNRRSEIILSPKLDELFNLIKE